MGDGILILGALLVLFVLLQGAALGLYLTSRPRKALCASAATALISFALMGLAALAATSVTTAMSLFLALQVAILIAAVLGLAIRGFAALFWPVWVASFSGIAMLVYLIFFFRVF